MGGKQHSSQSNTYSRRPSPQECQPLMAPAVAPLPGSLGYISIQITRSLKNSGGLLCVTDDGIPEKTSHVFSDCENTSHHIFPRVGNQQVQQSWT